MTTNDRGSRSPTLTTGTDIPADLTKTVDYGNLVREELDHYSNIEVTNDLKEGGIHAQGAWLYWYNYVVTKIWAKSFEEEIASYCNSVNEPRILSLGCGYGGVELDVAKLLRQPFEMLALDLNDGIMQEARARAHQEDLNIQFETADLNFVEFAEGTFDLIYAHASVHHILNLEHLVGQIHKGLKDNGRFVILEMIGKTQVLFWPENVEFAAQVVAEMPGKYKGHTVDPYAVLERYVEPDIQVGMEGIRQEEIEEQILRYFRPIVLYQYGSFMRLLCTNPIIGSSFDQENAEDRAYLDYLASLDVKQVAEQKLRPTEMFGVFVKKSNGSK